MRSIPLTASLLLVAACSGPGSVLLGGTVSGLKGTGLVLQLDGLEHLAIAADGHFTFDTPVKAGGNYTVTVLQQPSNPAQVCTVSAANGSLDNAVSVTCVTSSFAVGGGVSGLAGTGLVLQDNGGDNLAIAANGAFVFAGKLEAGKAWAVTVKSQPLSPSQTCTVAGGAGTMGSAAVTSVAVTCVTNSFKVSGSISGLTGAGLSLLDNGGDSIAVAAGASTFAFPAKVLSGASYAVTIAQQPTSPVQVCQVAKDHGAVGNADVSDVAITCTTTAFPVSVVVSGLAGTGLVLQDNNGDDLPVPGAGTFAFATGVPSGAPYAVTVKTQPQSPWQTCSAQRSSGTVVDQPVSVAVSCQTNSYPVTATVSGLLGAGLVLQDNGGDDLAFGSDGTLSFAQQVPSAGAFAVTVKSQPMSPAQLCVVSAPAGGTIGGSAANVAVTCTTRTFAIGGTVRGLGGSGLVLQDNGKDDLQLNANGSFVFPIQVASGAAFAVTIKTQPAGPPCSLSGASGTVGNADVTSVLVTCLVQPSALIVAGFGDADLKTQLASVGISATIVPATSITASFDYSPYNVIAYMYNAAGGDTATVLSKNAAGTLGIVCHRCDALQTTFGLAQASGYWQSGAFAVSDNSHYITSKFAVGPVDLTYTYKSIVNTPASATRVLGTATAPSLVVHTQYRRVVTPYYGHPAGMPGSAASLTLLQRTYEWAAGNGAQ